MKDHHTATLASSIVFATGAFWGFYWLPVRALAQTGLSGAWGTVAITGSAALLLLPLAVGRWRAIRRAGVFALASIAIGGAAFALYSVAFVYGRVAIVILLYFLTPVWSTLIGRYIMGWHTPPMRVFAIAVGLAGLALMLSADGMVPVPRNIGEWMALCSGLLWSVGTTGIRSKSLLGPIESAFVFALGAMVASCLLAPFLAPLPDGESLGDGWRLPALAFGAGGVWWVLSIGGLMWATVRLEPARVGILLMAEVLVGALSAALLADEHLHGVELLGGALVLLAGALEVWPVGRRRAPKGR